MFRVASAPMPLRLVSLFGLVVFLALAWALSSDRRRFPWRTVFSGLAIQLVIAFIILKTGPGLQIFLLANKAVTSLLGYAEEGTKFVFGPLADTALLAEKFGAPNAFIFFVTVTGTIILVSAISSFLYHYGILQRVVRGIAWVMQRVMGTSGSESLAAAANIFMGQTEAPLVIKPYLARMTRSELLAMMIGGMATIAGGVLAAYVAFGNAAGRTDMAGHLITASLSQRARVAAACENHAAGNASPARPPAARTRRSSATRKMASTPSASARAMA